MKALGTDERTRLLWRLRRRRFDRFRFRGLDALVARVPDATPVPLAIQAKIDGGSPQRWYPVVGGYLVKWPHDGGVVPTEGFWVEPGGWDHQHCDGCNRTIGVGGTVWLTVRGSWGQLCPYCHRRVAQFGRA
jgi:hypothetical protein